MINSTSNVHIDGNVIDHEELMRTFKFDSDDKFTQWVMRPLAVLAVLGIGVATFFVGAFVIVVSLATLPLLMAAMWALKYKLNKSAAEAEAVVSTQDGSAL